MAVGALYSTRLSMLQRDMEERTKIRLRHLAILVSAGAVAGIAYMPFISESPGRDEVLKFAAQGALIILLIFGFEFFVAQGPASEPLRRAPFAVAFAGKALITTLLIVIAYGIGSLVLFPNRFGVQTPFLDLVRDTGYAFSVALVLQFGLLVRMLVGGRVLTNIMLGRYHKPLDEERIFMVLDVSGSTGLAERFGGVVAYSMISRFFFDVAQETARYGGDTHEYIGDEVIVTWPLKRGAENGRCLECYFAICDRMELKAPLYRRDFGLVPTFRVGLHGGPIVAGECGDDKREIVYFGDTINTAARIQEICKEFRRPLLISGELLQRIELQSKYSAIGLGKVKLRGREKEIELFAVERQLVG
jgi:adenylate cyclase